MFKYEQFREFIVKPALKDLTMHSHAAVDLMMFTCAVESDGGTYIKQLHGPAIGIYQMEPETYNDLWQNYIQHNSRILMILLSNFDCHRMPPEDRMIYDLRFATAMCRLHYSRFKDPIPSSTEEIWQYYKLHYNTPKGAATKNESLGKYYNFIRA